MVFKAGVRIAALFNAKAKKWENGRKNIWERLKADFADQTSTPRKLIWMHCASLGEFEQGRPVIERIRTQYPHYKLLLTFFSPSGYEIRKNYSGVDWVYYLPMDGAQNAKRFLQIVNPSLVVFVKYEFWYYYLKEIKENNIPLLLVSALFRENSVFFKWYGSLQRKMLSFFSHLFVQTEDSKKLLDSIGFANHCSVSGDTRFDRVIEIAEKAEEIPSIEKFGTDKKIIVAGSTWPADEELLRQTLQKINDPSILLIIAPHEINPDHIAGVQKLFTGSVLFSSLVAGNLLSPGNTLIIDNIGLLSRLYQYAHITYIGGGFGKGIHNTLEAAVYGKPVLFGPAYHKFREAIDLVKEGAAISVNNQEGCVKAIQKLLHEKKLYEESCRSAREYVYANRGATDKILQFIQENRLLTS